MLEFLYIIYYNICRICSTIIEHLNTEQWKITIQSTQTSLLDYQIGNDYPKS